MLPVSELSIQSDICNQECLAITNGAVSVLTPLSDINTGSSSFLLPLMKRVTDISLSFTGLLIATPLILFYSLYLILIFRQNPVFMQKRALSKNHKPFTLFKLTTMHPGAHIEYLNNGTLKKTGKAKLFFPFGKLLRLSGIDESLQLILVLTGKMSLIGPRPLDFSDLERLEAYNPQLMKNRSQLKSKPGISGLWQLNRSPELSFDELLSLDKQYDIRKSVSFDFSLTIATIMKMIGSVHLDTLNERQ